MYVCMYSRYKHIEYLYIVGRYIVYLSIYNRIHLNVYIYTYVCMYVHAIHVYKLQLLLLRCLLVLLFLQLSNGLVFSCYCCCCYCCYCVKVLLLDVSRFFFLCMSMPFVYYTNTNFSQTSSLYSRS